jgi:hypothetical protein
MPEGFQIIPDWFPWENQGAGMAVADLGGGQQHLVGHCHGNRVWQPGGKRTTVRA